MLHTVLATSLYFHASFLLPSDALLAEIVSCLYRFMATGCLQEGPVGPHAQPGRGATALPGNLVACSGPDVPAQVQALHAKVAAMLLHPRRRTWNLLMCVAGV